MLEPRNKSLMFAIAFSLSLTPLSLLALFY